MSGRDVPDEPEERRPADNTGDSSAGPGDQDAPADRSGFRLVGAFGSVRLADDPRYQGIFRDILPQLKAFREQQRIAETLIQNTGGFDRLQKQILAAQPSIELFRAQQPFAEGLFKSINAAGGLQRVFDTLSHLDAFREFTRSAVPELAKLPHLHLPADWYPPNWEQVPEFDVDAALSIVVDEGIPLVWVPRSAIVTRLVAAADADARDEIILSVRGDIADDCLTVLGEITAPELKPLAELAADAVSALRDGHGPSAQALAANVFDTLLREAVRRGVIFAGPPVGYFKYDKVRKQITPVSDDTVIRRFRADCVLSAALAALQDYDPSDPAPDRFVRHATAHSARPGQYTPVNAAVAVMLMASMLREAQASGW